MNILVTGSQGFIGKHVTRALREHGHHVTELDYSLGHDISNPYIPPDTEVVIHLAAMTSSSSKRFTNYLFTVNVRGTLRVLEESIEAKVPRFIFSSSAGVYDCLSCYGASKAAAEIYCKVANDRIDTKILRFFNVYGPGQTRKSGALVPKVLSALFQGNEIQITGDGTQTRDFIFVRDIAHVLVEEVEKSFVPSGQPVDVGTGIETQVKEVVERLQAHYNCLVENHLPVSEPVYVPLEQRQALQSRAQSPEYIAELITTSLDEGLQNTTRFWRDVVHKGDVSYARS